MGGESDKGQSLELKKRHPGKSQQPNEDSDAEVEPIVQSMNIHRLDNEWNIGQAVNGI